MYVRQCTVDLGAEGEFFEPPSVVFNFHVYLHQCSPHFSISPPRHCISPTPASPSSSSSPNRPAMSSPPSLSPKRANTKPPALSSSRHRNCTLTLSYLPHRPRRPLICHTNTSLQRHLPGNHEPLSLPDTPTPTRKAFIIWHSSRPATLEPIFSPQKPQFSAYSLPPRVVTPRDFISTLTSGLDYQPSYSTHAIQRSYVDRRSSSPTYPNTQPASCPTAPAHSLPIYSHDAPDKSVLLVLTCRSFKSYLPRSSPHGYFAGRC